MDMDSLKPAPYNPRAISAEALAGLQKSLHLFGDISGLVWNQRTGHLVAGHQRLAALKAEWGNGLRFLREPFRIECPDETMSTPSSAFPIRVVDWDEPTERAANIAANATTIQGEFTPELGPLLDELRDTFPAFDDLMFDDLQCKGDVDLDELWKDMPEFEQEDVSTRAIIVHFKTEQDVQAFAEVIGQKLTEKTRAIWYPEAKQESVLSMEEEDES